MSESGTEQLQVLNLYAGVGGNRALWEDVDVTAVEIDEEIAAEYQRQFPGDDVIVADAHQFLLDHYDAGWDFIWASPPCQTHSKVSYATWHAEEAHNADRDPQYPDMRLYQEVVLLDHFFEGEWVVENVDPYYEELLDPQKAGRHLFWSNYHIPGFEKPSRDFEMSRADQEELEDWLGIELTRTIYANGNDPGQVLKNCVHPELGKHVFEARSEPFEQQTLLADGSGEQPTCMKYVEVSTEPVPGSARSTDDRDASTGRSARLASSKDASYGEIGENSGHTAALPLTSFELVEENQALPVVQPQNLLDEGRELDRAPIPRTVFGEVLSEELPRQHPAVVQQRAEPEEEDPDAVVARFGSGHQLRLLVGVGILDSPTKLVPADDLFRTVLGVERPVGTPSLPEDLRDLIDIEDIRLVTVGVVAEGLLLGADDGLEVLLIGVVPVGFGDDTDLLGDPQVRVGYGVVFVVVESAVHGRERALELVTATLQPDGRHDISLPAEPEDTGRLETRVQSQRVDGDVIIGLGEEPLNEVVGADVLRIGFDRDGNVLVVLLVVRDQRSEVEAVGRPVLGLPLPVALSGLALLRPVRNHRDVDVAVEAALEHPGARRGLQEAVVHTLELLVPSSRVALFDGVKRRLDRELVVVVVDDVGRRIVFLGSFEERREDRPVVVLSSGFEAVEVRLVEHDRSDVPDLLVDRRFGDLRQGLGTLRFLQLDEVRIDQTAGEAIEESIADVLGEVAEVAVVSVELGVLRVVDRAPTERVVGEPQRLPNRRVAVEVKVQLVIGAAGQDSVEVGAGDGVRVLATASIESVVELGDRAGRVGNALRDRLLAEGRFGRRAGGGVHKGETPNMIDKSRVGGSGNRAVVA